MDDPCLSASVSSQQLSSDQLVITPSIWLAELLLSFHPEANVVFSSVDNPYNHNVLKDALGVRRKVTGAISAYDTVPKTIEYARELWPQLRTFGVLVDAGSFTENSVTTLFRISGERLRLNHYLAATEADVRAQIARAHEEGVELMIVPYSVLTLTVPPARLCAMLGEHGIKSATNYEFILRAGCLISFNQRSGEIHRLLASQAVEAARHGDASRVPLAFAQTLEVGVNVDALEKYRVAINERGLLRATYLIKNERVRNLSASPTISN